MNSSFLNTKSIICNTKFIIFNTKSVILNKQFINFDKEFISFDTEFINFDTEFINCDTEFINCDTEFINCNANRYPDEVFASAFRNSSFLIQNPSTSIPKSINFNCKIPYFSVTILRVSEKVHDTLACVLFLELMQKSTF